MVNKRFDNGFSLVELLVVIGLIAILASAAIPPITKYFRTYKYIEYATSMENLVRWARLTAIERTVNVGLCIQGNTLQIINMGANRTNICSGSVINSLQITHNFVSLSGAGAAFDPKGFAIFDGNVCVTNNSEFYRVRISRFGAIRTEKGTGGC